MFSHEKIMTWTDEMWTNEEHYVQQDWLPPHYCNSVRDFLNDHLSEDGQDVEKVQSIHTDLLI
jgi:hypothetical protein